MDSRMLRKTTWELKFRPDLGETFCITSKWSWTGWSSSEFFCCPIFFSLRATNKRRNYKSVIISDITQGIASLCSHLTRLVFIRQSAQCVADYIKCHIFCTCNEMQTLKFRSVITSSQVLNIWLILTDCSLSCSWSPDWFPSFTIQCDPLQLNAACRLNRWCSSDDTLRSSLSKNDHNHRYS